MREGRGIRAEHIAGHQRHRTERHRPRGNLTAAALLADGAGARSGDARSGVSLFCCDAGSRLRRLRFLLANGRDRGTNHGSGPEGFGEITIDLFETSKPVSRYLHCFRHSPEIYLIAGASRVLALQADPDRTPAAPRDIPSTWVFLLPGTAQTSLPRLRPVPPEFDALFAAARRWDTLTGVSLPLP